MAEIIKYSQYRDHMQRQIIVLAVHHEVIVTVGVFKAGEASCYAVPIRVELLNVEERQAKIVSVVDFERWVSAGKLKEVK